MYPFVPDREEYALLLRTNIQDIGILRRSFYCRARLIRSVLDTDTDLTMVEKILVAVDGSETMERTVRFACDLVKVLGGSLTLIHVVDVPVMIQPNLLFDSAPLIRSGEMILQTAQKQVEHNGLKADIILEQESGNSGHTIVAVAQEKGFTLIVMHAKGHSKAAAILLGSVCHTVAHNASCSVLILRP
jgi:nucleotide-binding universal stress UspA family protein